MRRSAEHASLVLTPDRGIMGPLKLGLPLDGLDQLGFVLIGALIHQRRLLHMSPMFPYRVLRVVGQSHADRSAVCILVKSCRYNLPRVVVTRVYRVGKRLLELPEVRRKSTGNRGVS